MTTKRSLPRITAKQFVANRNDEVRDALNVLGRAVLPHVNLADVYLTDLMHDAISMANMADEETVRIVVTSTGTHLCRSEGGVHELCLFKVTCTAPKKHYLHRTWRIRKETT